MDHFGDQIQEQIAIEMVQAHTKKVSTSLTVPMSMPAEKPKRYWKSDQEFTP
jgi:hypothetical protein